MSTPKKESAKTPAKSAAKPAAKKPASKKPAADKAEEKVTKATKPAQTAAKPAPAAKKAAAKPEPKKAAPKKPAVKPVEEVPAVKEPDDFDIMMGLAPAPVVQPVEEEEAPAKAGKESKSREKRSKTFTPQVSAAEMNEFFAEDSTLKTAFKALLAIAKKNNGYVTSEDIENSLPPDETEDDDQARLFERLHEVGVEVRDDEEYAVKPLSAEELNAGDGRLVCNQHNCGGNLAYS